MPDHADWTDFRVRNIYPVIASVRLSIYPVVSGRKLKRLTKSAGGEQAESTAHHRHRRVAHSHGSRHESAFLLVGLPL